MGDTCSGLAVDTQDEVFYDARASLSSSVDGDPTGGESTTTHSNTQQDVSGYDLVVTLKPEEGTVYTEREDRVFLRCLFHFYHHRVDGIERTASDRSYRIDYDSIDACRQAWDHARQHARTLIEWITR